MISKNAVAGQELERRRQQRRRKPAAVTPLTSGELAAAAEEAAERKSEAAAHKAALRSLPRKLNQTPKYALLPARKKLTPEAKCKARAAAQKKYQEKVKRNVPKETARRDAERVRQKEWVRRKRVKARAAKFAQFEAGYRELYICWLQCWAMVGVCNGWALPRHENLRSPGLGRPLSVMQAGGGLVKNSSRHR
jgi:hypothetical protein